MSTYDELPAVQALREIQAQHLIATRSGMALEIIEGHGGALDLSNPLLRVTFGDGNDLAFDPVCPFCGAEERYNHEPHDHHPAGWTLLV